MNSTGKQGVFPIHIYDVLKVTLLHTHTCVYEWRHMWSTVGKALHVPLLQVLKIHRAYCTEKQSGTKMAAPQSHFKVCSGRARQVLFSPTNRCSQVNSQLVQIGELGNSDRQTHKWMLPIALAPCFAKPKKYNYSSTVALNNHPHLSHSITLMGHTTHKTHYIVHSR